MAPPRLPLRAAGRPRPAAAQRRRPAPGLLSRPRPPALHWALAVVLAVAAAAAVVVPARRADGARRAAGTTRPVLVALADLPAGHVLEPDDVAVEDRPVRAVPVGALDGPQPGAVLAAATYRGEPVLRARLAPAGVGPVAARLPAGSRALAVPTGPGAPPLAAGDAVDVLVTLDPTLTGASAPTIAVARAAVVVEVGDDVVTLAVPAADAPRVAFAVGQGLVALALRPDAPAP